MKYHLLGQRTGLHVSALALGTGRLDVTEASRIFSAYAEAGGNFLDTSSAYLGGKAEELVGDFLATTDRERFVISSKYCRTPFAARRARRSPIFAAGRRSRRSRCSTTSATVTPSASSCPLHGSVGSG